MVHVKRHNSFLFCEKENGGKAHKYFSYAEEKKQDFETAQNPGFKLIPSLPV